MAAATLAFTAGCGGAARPGAADIGRTGPVRGATQAAHQRPARFGPVSFSFTSGSDGWMLGVTHARHQAIELVKTTDGGRRWTAVPVPPAPWIWSSSARDAVSQVTFANARDGWLYGPGLWATHDGGARWQRIPTGGRVINSVAAGDGTVLATFTVCHSRCGGSAPRFAVYRAAVGSDTFRPVPGATGPGFGGLTIAGTHAYAVGDGFAGQGVALLGGPVAGPGRWQRQPEPCGPSLEPSLLAATDGLWLACSQNPGIHPVKVVLYRSANAARSWKRAGQLSLEDGAGSLSVTPSGVIVTGGMYNGLLISRDGGRAWRRVPSVDNTDVVGGGGVVLATMINGLRGVVIVKTARAWITTDGGRTWLPMRIR
jgi:hypothetical protein